MTEIPEVSKFKPIVTVLWIALITAIIVTVIDWRIKQDILRMTTTFYKIYPWDKDNEIAETADRRSDPDTVLPFPAMDIHARMEEEADNAAPEPSVESSLWKYGDFLESVEPGGNEDSGSVSS